MTQLRSNFLHAALSWSISSCPSRRSWRSSFSFFSFSLASFSLTFSSLSLWRAFSRRVILALRSWRSSEVMGGASEVMGGASEVIYVPAAGGGALSSPRVCPPPGMEDSEGGPHPVLGQQSQDHHPQEGPHCIRLRK